MDKLKTVKEFTEIIESKINMPYFNSNFVVEYLSNNLAEVSNIDEEKKVPSWKKKIVEKNIELV